jgi:hypothetical protein
VDSPGERHGVAPFIPLDEAIDGMIRDDLLHYIMNVRWCILHHCDENTADRINVTGACVEQKHYNNITTKKLGGRRVPNSLQ